MTRTAESRTEERLRDALHASAARVRDDRLRPLPPPRGQASHASHATAAVTQGPHRHKAWLPPVAAAASVLLIVGLALAVTGHFTSKAGPARPTTTSSTPRYYVAVTDPLPEKTARLGVFAAATGKLVASTAEPTVPARALLFLAAAAVAPDDRTFYAEFHIVMGNTTSQLKIYQFSLTSSHSATPLSLVKGGVLTGPDSQYNMYGAASLAVSPDGTELALTTNSPTITPDSQGESDRLVAISLRTGRQIAWQGGLDRDGKVFSIQDVSWSADSQSLVYLATWCTPAHHLPCYDGPGVPKGRTAQVRQLPLGSGGGSLAQGRVLLSQSSRYPFIEQAFAGPVDGLIIVLVFSGSVNSYGVWSHVSVDVVVDASGAVLNVDYQSSGSLGDQGLPGNAWIRPDASGQSLLYTYAGGKSMVIGVLAHDRFHRLPFTAPPYAW